MSVTVIVPLASSVASSAVATLSVALVASAAIVTLAGAVPSRKLPLSADAQRHGQGRRWYRPRG